MVGSLALTTNGDVRGKCGDVTGAQWADQRSELSRYDSCHSSITFQIWDRNWSSTNRQRTPRSYREDADKKDQAWAFLDRDSAPLKPDKYAPTIRSVATPTVDKGGRT
jgi:hypothetical protein